MKIFIFFLIFLFAFPVLSQVETNSTAPQFTNDRIEKIPGRVDDEQTEKLLKEMSKKAGWFPNIKINVLHGIVVIDGKAKDQKQLSWLAKTAEKLPTVIAVINRADIETTSFTDMTPLVNEVKRIANGIKKHLPRLGIALILGSLLFYLGIKIHHYSKMFWRRRISNVFLASTVARIMMIPVGVMFFYICLMIVGLQNIAATIIGGTGVLGIVLGFAFKGIAENYLSGLLLAIRSPFTKGDFIKVDNSIEGIVQNLNMRGTTLLDFDGNLILVPNTMVIQSVVKNLSVNANRRSTFTIGVGFTNSIKKCQDLAMEALKSVTGISMDPAPMIYVENLGDSTVNIRIYFWFNSKTCSEAILKSSAIVKTKEIFLANGIDLPDPSREMILLDPLKVHMIQDRSEVEAVKAEKKQVLKDQAKENFHEAESVVADGADHEEELRKIAEKVALPTQSGSTNLLQPQ